MPTAASTPPRARVRRRSADRAQPPAKPSRLGLGSLRDTDWRLIRSDADGRLFIENKTTGALRLAPWVSFYTSSGAVYFANLATQGRRSGCRRTS